MPYFSATVHCHCSQNNKFRLTGYSQHVAYVEKNFINITALMGLAEPSICRCPVHACMFWERNILKTCHHRKYLLYTHIEGKMS